MDYRESMNRRLSATLAGMVLFAGPFINSCSGQGQVHFNTRVVGVVDARFLCPDGTGLGPEFTAQLFGGPAGAPSPGLSPLFPTTTFRSGGAAGYVVPVDVVVPGVAPGQQATLVMRAFLGDSFGESVFRMESNPITITLGGGLFPPANLIGLQGVVIIGGGLTHCIPEPTPPAMLIAGILVLAIVGAQRMRPNSVRGCRIGPRREYL